MSDPAEVVPHLQCERAEELLEKLAPNCELWKPNPTAWVFRGHADSAWKLLARGHRPQAYEGLCIPPEILAREPDWECRQQCELWMVSEFHRALDDAGLPVPSAVIAPKMRSSSNTYGDEVRREAWPVLALAQHHGLPTSLLDWSRRSRVAAYFAAADFPKINPDGLFAIWALRIDYVEARRYESDALGLMEAFRAPRSTNPNLHAQAGLFTMLRGCEHPTPVDEYVAHDVANGIMAKHGLEGCELPLMRKLSLPRREAPKLLRLLSYEGINGATMFPGYDGVAVSMREQAQWDELPKKPKWRPWD